MRVWRIVARKWASTAFSGEGARIAGGRFTPVGVPAVYCTSSIALAALEIVAHADETARSKKWSVLAADVPDSLLTLVVDVKDLGRNWRHVPPPVRLQNLGKLWARSNASLVLSVPSVLVPAERNYILNPLHPDFGRITIHAPEPFSFDERLFR